MAKQSVPAEDIGFIKAKLEAIHEQTTKTNGRVTRLEFTVVGLVVALSVLMTATFILNPEMREVIKAIPK